MTPMERYNATERQMQHQHDSNIKGHSRATLQAALRDLSTKRRTGKDPEARWVRHRIAAVKRALYATELISH